MRRIGFVALFMVLLSGSLFSCATSYQAYRADIFEGKKLLNTGDYGKAREDFTKAAQAEPGEPASYALAATAAYKLGDFDAARTYIQEAAKRDRHSDSSIRILGYGSLILLKEGKEQEGLEALHKYILAYQNEYAPFNVRQVERMWRTKKIDLASLENLLDDEIGTYESDMELFRRSGTGWFAQKYMPPPGGPW